MYSTFVAIIYFNFFLFLVALHSDFLRKNAPFLVFLKFITKLNSTILFIPVFSIFRCLFEILALNGNTLRCLPKGNNLVWKVFPNLICFQGYHLTMTILAFVASFCQIVIKYLHDISFYDTNLGSKSMFAK